MSRESAFADHSASKIWTSHRRGFKPIIQSTKHCKRDPLAADAERGWHSASRAFSAVSSCVETAASNAYAVKEQRLNHISEQIRSGNRAAVFPQQNKTLSAASAEKLGKIVKMAGERSNKGQEDIGKGVKVTDKRGAKDGRLPGSALDVACATVKGVTDLPGNVINLATNLVTRNRRKSAMAGTNASRVRTAAPATKIELQFECRNLRQKDAFAECDAFAVLWKVPAGYEVESAIGRVGADDSFCPNLSLSGEGKYSGANRKGIPNAHRLPARVEQEMGRTEVFSGSHSPTFATTFILDFEFHAEAKYVVRVYDLDLGFCSDLKQHDFLGGTMFSLAELMATEKRTLKRPLNGHREEDGKHRKSFLVIRGVETRNARTTLDFRFSAKDLRGREKVIEKLDDPYFEILRLEPKCQTWSQVYKSEVLKQQLSPTWAKTSLPLPTICGDDLNNPIQIKFWNSIRQASEPLGCVETSVKKLVDGAKKGIPNLDVWHENKKILGRNKQIKCGVLKILRAELKEVPSMLDYIAAGYSVDLTFAVDYSLSNGKPDTESYVHCRSNKCLNIYQTIIQKVGSLIIPYSSEQDFSIWGFGSDTGGEKMPRCLVGESDGATKRLLNPPEKISITSLIQMAMYRAIQGLEPQHCYCVLCILTGGNIVNENLNHMIDMICTAAEDAPLSIVLFGIGEDKEAFETIGTVMGADGGNLRHSNGVPIARNNISFVAVNAYDDAASAVANALQDVPEQLVEYFTANGILPGLPHFHTRQNDDR